MVRATRNRHQQNGLSAQWVSLLSPNCPGDRQRNEIFAAGTEPTTQDNTWQAIGGQLYQILPQEAADWVRENGIPQPSSGGGDAGASVIRVGNEDAGINYPGTGGYVNGVIEIKGNARGGPYRVEFGVGEQPDSWTQIGPEHGEEVQDGRAGNAGYRSIGRGYLHATIYCQPWRWSTRSALALYGRSHTARD